jgi:hypothetical protein
MKAGLRTGRQEARLPAVLNGDDEVGGGLRRSWEGEATRTGIGLSGVRPWAAQALDFAQDRPNVAAPATLR